MTPNPDANAHPHLAKILPFLPPKITLLTYNADAIDAILGFIASPAGTSARAALFDNPAEPNGSSHKTGGESNGLKRTRDDALPEPKRPKLSPPPEPTPPSFTTPAIDAEPPLYTLHAISTTAPIRKKADISISRSSITFTHPTTHAFECSVPIENLTRAFLLPTRNKPKGHWTVILLCSDTPSSPGASSSSKSRTSPAAPKPTQIIFGLDATTTTAFSTTSTDSSARTTHPKGTPTHALLRAFLSFLPPRVTVLEPVLSPPTNALAVPAYLNAKSSTLWFLPGGILWGESRPVEYWACEDLMRGSEGVRVVSATGRTCSVYLTRKGSGGGGDEDEEGEEEDGDEEEDLGEETEFAMIEGREMEGISRWVRERRGAFGRTPGSGPVDEEARGKQEKVVHAGPMTINQIGDDEDEDEDGSFEGSSSDSGSGGASSGEEGTDGGDEGEREPLDEDEDDGGDAEGDEDGEGELDPAHHPLMRPGAMPRMSRAVLDMVVDLVEDDMMGGGEQDGRDNSMVLDSIVPLTTGVVHVASDEEDELED